MKSVDLLVVGTGPAASRVANRCVRSGWRVAIAEKREFGGTCALRGCNPKKVYVRAAELIDWARRCEGKLIEGENLRINWSRLLEFKRSFTDDIPEKSEAGYRRKGIDTYHGEARFLGPQNMQVGATEIQARHIMLATGAVSAPLKFPGSEHLLHSDGFLELEQLPPRMLFLGGGYISFEFAHVAARAGAAVTILDHGPRVLKRFSAKLTDKLVERSRQIGIEVICGAEVESIELQGDGVFSIRAAVDGGSSELRAEAVIHGAGRVPNLEGLDLPVGNVDFNDSGIVVSDQLQSVSNRAVYAAGDCAATGAPPLTPVANQEARTVASNLLEGGGHTAEYGALPTAVFTVPGLASVGLTVEEARAKQLDFELREGDMSDWSSVRKVGEPAAAYEILVDSQTGRILGAHLLGPLATETINLLAMAMQFNLTVDDVKSVLYTFPTFAADVRDML